jgi:hypothetical protein
MAKTKEAKASSCKIKVRTPEELMALWEHGGEECNVCHCEDYEQNLIKHEGKLYCEPCCEALDIPTE